MLKQRTLSALVLAPIVLGACFFGGVAFLSLIALIAGFCAREYRNMVVGAGMGLNVMFIPLCMAIALSGFTNRIDWLLASIIAGSLILLAMSIKGGAPNGVFGVAGAVYIGGLLGSWSLLRAQPDGREWCFLVLFVTWANDMGAYFGGRAFGKRKLAPAISPGKSWEGAAFGLGAGVAASTYFGLWVGFSPAVGALAGAFLAVLAQVGDLVESRFKRYCRVKDSGGAIPGHGGFLDRFDSLLFTGTGGMLLKGIYGLLFH